jgi:anti-anti-sigma factor
MPITSTVSDNGAVVTIQVSGRFDFATHQEFMRAYKEYPRGEKKFVVDLKNAEYLDSSAMGMLLQLRDYGGGGDIRILNGNDAVREILRIANFDKLFSIA